MRGYTLRKAPYLLLSVKIYMVLLPLSEVIHAYREEHIAFSANSECLMAIQVYDFHSELMMSSNKPFYLFSLTNCHSFLWQASLWTHSPRWLMAETWEWFETLILKHEDLQLNPILQTVHFVNTDILKFCMSSELYMYIHIYLLIICYCLLVLLNLALLSWHYCWSHYVDLCPCTLGLLSVLHHRKYHLSHFP